MDPLKELEGLDPSHQLALVKQLGGKKVIERILRGEVTVEIREAIKLLFDKRARRIPRGLQNNVCDANKGFYLEQQQITKDFCAERLKLSKYWDRDRAIGIDENSFWQGINKLKEIIQADRQISNILRGIWLPVVMPVLPEKFDLGTILEQYLEAVAESYSKTFNRRAFYNHCKGTLADNVSIVDGSRQDQLIQQMKQGPVPGIYFPTSLQGFSMYAGREQMEELPKGFVLSGLDTIIAMIWYPDILARDFYTPNLDLAALSPQSPVYSFYFGAGDGRLNFDRRSNLSYARDYSSSGLFFFEEC